jgi:DNA-binding protein HU-beta
VFAFCKSFVYLFQAIFGGLSITHIQMNKADLVSAVHEVLGSTKADAERAVETIIDSITATLKKGDEVSIAGLGIFATKVREARTGRNPRTGEAVEIPSVRVPKFRAAKALKDAVK